MKLPKQAKPVMRTMSTSGIEAGVNSSVNTDCILTKCAPCAAKLISGDVAGAAICAISNCPQCFV